MPVTSPLYGFADHLLEGSLAEKIAAWRGEGKSWDSIAKLIWAATGQKVDVSSVTVSKWARELGIEPERAA